MTQGQENEGAREQLPSHPEVEQERIGRDPDAEDVFDQKRFRSGDTNGDRDEQREPKRPRYEDGGNRGPPPRDRDDNRGPPPRDRDDNRDGNRNRDSRDRDARGGSYRGPPPPHMRDHRDRDGFRRDRDRFRGRSPPRDRGGGGRRRR